MPATRFASRSAHQGWKPHLRMVTSTTINTSISIAFLRAQGNLSSGASADKAKWCVVYS